VRRLRRQLQRRAYNRAAVIGDETGTVYAGLGKIWVRFRAGTDEYGTVTYTPAVKVNRGDANYIDKANAPVRIIYDENDELTVKGIDNKEYRNAGIDSAIVNYGSKSSRWFLLKYATRAACRPVGNATDTSTLVSVRGMTYVDNYGDIHDLPETARQADKIDLASYIPAAGYHRIVCVFARTIANTYQVTGSTAQLETSALDLTDFQECFDQADAETIPLGAFKLHNAQTTIDIRDFAEDLRQFVNMPQRLGFPDPVDKQQIVRSGQTQFIGGTLTVTDTLIVEGTVTVAGSGMMEYLWRDHEPNSMTVSAGTLASGSVSDVKVMLDGNIVQIEEVAATPGFNVQFSFTNVSQSQPPNFVNARYRYDGSATHFVSIDLYNYTDAAWNQWTVFTTTDDYYQNATIYIPNGNRANYVDSSGNAKVRIYHNTAGNASHDLYIDYVGLSHGVHS